jgi:uncharacterized phage-associated protein
MDSQMSLDKLPASESLRKVDAFSLSLVRYDVNRGQFVVGPAILEEDQGTPMSPLLEVIQRFIIKRHRDLFGESPSPMKLQKLCYYAQGYLLAQGRELFPEDFQAWQHGPVIPGLYNRYRDFGWRGISDDMEFNDAELDGDVAREVSDIVTAYGRYDGAALSTMTHREAPWMDARGDLPEDQGSTQPIPKAALNAYFAGKLAADGRR